MPEEVRLWNIQSNNKLRELTRSRLDLEDRLESWLVADISILSDDLLVIGKQVTTDFGGIIDLLCLNQEADCVVVELKRHRTPREITAQVLDYASWVSELDRTTIEIIANEYFKNTGTIESAFTEKFKRELPDTLNENHSMLIVASEIDSSSERIIKYLSDTHGISINAATFHYFRMEEGGEFLARIFLIEPTEVEYKQHLKGPSKRRRYATLEELREKAEANGVGAMFQRMASELDKYFSKHTTTNSLAFTNTSNRVLFSLIPNSSNAAQGLYFQIYFQRFLEASYLGAEATMALLPQQREAWKYSKDADADYSGYAGFFKDEREVEAFLLGLTRT